MREGGRLRAVLVVSGIFLVLVALVVALETPAREQDASHDLATSVLAPGWPGQPSLVAGTEGGGRTVVAVPMGHFTQPLNTFWQVVVPSTSGRGGPWVVRTPPGVATNGGLVVEPSPTGGIVSGVRGSQNLAFSVLATSPDGGTTWSPKSFPGGLVASPDALAAAAGTTAALVEGTWVGRREVSSVGQTVVVGLGSSGVWTPSLTSNSLARSACGVTRLDAVAVSAAGVVSVGATCAHAGEFGLFERGADGWSLVGPSLADVVYRDTGQRATSVLRLTYSGTALDALVGVRGARADWLEVITVESGASSSSTPIALHTGEHVVATATDESGDVAVLTSDRRVVTHGANLSSWTVVPRPPFGTTAISLSSAGSSGQTTLEALATAGSTIQSFTLVPTSLEPSSAIATAGPDRWSIGARTPVSIPYGSSS